MDTLERLNALRRRASRAASASPWPACSPRASSTSTSSSRAGCCSRCRSPGWRRKERPTRTSRTELIEPAVVDAVIRQQHEDIVRAIERGDPDAAERAMREHIVYVQDLVTVVRRESERCKH